MIPYIWSRFRHRSRSLRRFYLNVLITMLALILSLSLTATYFSFVAQKNRLLASSCTILTSIGDEYRSVFQNFWQLYLPIFENKAIYQEVYNYFANPMYLTRSPADRANLRSVMRLMSNRDSRVAWIAFYSPLREQNFVYLVAEDTLIQLDNNSEIWNTIQNKKRTREIHSATIYPEIGTTHTFTICGGVPGEMGAGTILVGYPCSLFNRYTQRSLIENRTRYILTCSDGYIYDSFALYPETQLEPPLPDRVLSSNSFEAAFYIDETALNMKAHQNTPLIIGIGLSMSLLAVFFYVLFAKRIFIQVKSIKNDLEYIGNNNLDYRLPEAKYAGELGSIARSVNKMTAKLEILIENEYVYRLRQREAELAELQAKFDPHFLYNSLEIIRGRVYDNGDIETADIIKKLSQLFRSFISKKRFVTIQDELAFCNSYFCLVHPQQSDNLQVYYDVDSNLLLCGIIRNLLQPIIENYFVHGFNAQSAANCVTIRCTEDDDDHILISVIDNGGGIDDNRLMQVMAAINSPDDSTSQSYGLRNLAQRIQLFYGPECSLTLRPNKECGVTVSMRIRRMSCEEHEAVFQASLHSSLKQN